MNEFDLINHVTTRHFGDQNLFLNIINHLLSKTLLHHIVLYSKKHFKRYNVYIVVNNLSIPRSCIILHIYYLILIII